MSVTGELGWLRSGGELAGYRPFLQLNGQTPLNGVDDAGNPSWQHGCSRRDGGGRDPNGAHPGRKWWGGGSRIHVDVNRLKYQTF